MGELLRLIGVLLVTSCGLDPRHYYRDNYAPLLNHGQSFDFIVVGSGPGGAACASRLAENPNWRVLLIEAGDYPNAESEIPAAGIALVGSDYDWKYRMQPMQNAAKGTNNGTASMARGKILGGSSSINGMVYTRGLQSDYDTWAKMGNTGWAWKDVEPFYKKLERQDGTDNVNYGKSGRLALQVRQAPNEFQRYALEAGGSLGYAVNHYEESKAGFFLVPTTSEAGTRFSAAKAYLNKAKTRPNLFVAVNTLVTKVLMRKNAAIGVEVLRNGIPLQIRANREVVVSAGAIGSPQLLMLSGIGPEHHLKSLNITVRKDLPVGENYQDHVLNMGILIKHDPLKSFDKTTDSLNYCLFRNGTLSQGNSFNMIWSFRTVPNENEPSIQAHFINFQKGDSESFTGYYKRLNGNETFTRKVAGILETHDVLYMPTFLSIPHSRGRILLNSTNPSTHPSIHGEFYTDKNARDFNAMLNAVDSVKTLLNTPALKRLNPEIIRLDIPECLPYETNSKQYWQCHIKHMSTSGLHPAGSCKMGPVGDKTAVVDPTLKVHGVENLRVADASIMPVVTSRNTQAPAYMIGERAAEFIKRDNSYFY